MFVLCSITTAARRHNRLCHRTQRDKAHIYIVEARTVLWHEKDKKKLGNLVNNVRVGLTAKTDPKQPGLSNVVVLSGDLKGTAGWIEKKDIKPFSGPALPKLKAS